MSRILTQVVVAVAEWFVKQTSVSPFLAWSILVRNPICILVSVLVLAAYAIAAALLFGVPVDSLMALETGLFGGYVVGHEVAITKVRTSTTSTEGGRKSDA